MHTSTKYPHRQNKMRGFFALITVTLLSFVMLAAAVSLSQFSLRGQFALLSSEFKTHSYVIARGCLTLAEIALHTNRHYTVTEKDVSVGTETCTLSVQKDALIQNQSNVSSSANYRDTSTTLYAAYDTNAQHFLFVQEVPVP